MTSSSEPAATLMLGGQPRIVVAVARSLHRRGIPVIAATVHAWDAGIRSRAIRAIETLPDLLDDPVACGRELLALIDRHRVDCLMVGSDQALTVVNAHHAELSRRVRVTCPPPGIVARVLDKEEALRAAEAAGVPVPRTHHCAASGELMPGTPALRFPVVVKLRARGGAAGHPDLDAVQHCEDEAALRALAGRLDGLATDWIVQEYHEGDDVFLALLVHDGEAVARFQCRATKTLPRRGGPSVMTVAEPVDEAMAAQAMAVLRRLGWEGLAQVDFRRDRRTGRWVFLEINGRFWGSLAAAGHAGQDFPWYVWQQAHGRRPQAPMGYPAGQRVRWLTGDLRRLVAILGGDHGPGALSRGDRWREALRFVVDFRPTVAGMIWSWRDPWPAVEELGFTLWYWLLTRLRRGAGGRSAPPDAPPVTSPAGWDERRPDNSVHVVER